MPISCRREVNDEWRHWLQVSVQARHDEQSVCVCMWRAGRQYIVVLSMATGRRAHGLPLSSSVGHWLLPSVLFCGMGGREGA